MGEDFTFIFLLAGVISIMLIVEIFRMSKNIGIIKDAMLEILESAKEKEE